MHPNPNFRKVKTQRNIAFCRERAFGTLAINGVEADAAPLLSHIPFQLSEDGTTLEAHLVRSNPILRVLDAPQPAVISVLGPDGYISPDWYGVEDQVPTWNYVAVHLRGWLEQRPAVELTDVLDHLSVAMEARLAPKQPWTMEKMSPEALEKMLRQIVPITLRVDEINGTWKLSQNKPDAARTGATDKLNTSSIGSELDQLIDLMVRRDLE